MKKTSEDWVIRARGKKTTTFSNGQEDDCCALGAVMHEAAKEYHWLVWLLLFVWIEDFPKKRNAARFLRMSHLLLGSSISWERAVAFADEVIELNDDGSFDSAWRAMRAALPPRLFRTGHRFPFELMLLESPFDASQPNWPAMNRTQPRFVGRPPRNYAPPLAGVNRMSRRRLIDSSHRRQYSVN